MKFIPINNIQNVIASAETYTYKDDNVLEESIEKKWKSTSTSGTLTCTISEGDCITLYNHNADNISITIKDLEGSTLAGPYATDLSTYTYGNACLWQEYTTQSEVHNAVISFTNARANPLFCGVAFGGTMTELRNPNDALGLTYNDNSLNRNLSSRSFKQAFKNIKKVFSTSVIVTLENDWFNAMKSLKNQVGFSPIPWLLLDDQFTTHNIYGYLSNFQDGVYNSALNTSFPVEIIER